MKETNLDEVLEEYLVASQTENKRQVLRSLMEKYPQFAADLMDLAAAEAFVKYAPEEELSAAEKEHYAGMGRRNFQAVWSSLNLDKPLSQAKLQSLTGAAQTKGLTKSKLAAALGLSISLVMYLEKRRIEFGTIPSALITKIADVLTAEKSLIIDYLQQTPDLASGASFKANTRPESTRPKSFAEVVEEDQTLSPEAKRNLLNLK